MASTSAPHATNKKYFFFAMKNGMGDAFILGASNAEKHRSDYAGLIEQEKSWATYKSYATFKKQHSNPAAGLLSPSAPTSSNDAAAVADKIVAQLKTRDVCDHFMISYKTTSSSHKAVFIIEPFTQYGSMFWGFKAEFMTEIFNVYPNVVPINDPYLNEALTNMTVGKRSDPDNADKNYPLITVYSPPKEPEKKLQIDNYVAYTFLTIPHTTLESAIREDEWMSATAYKIGSGLRDLMQTQTFRATLERIGERRRHQFVAKLYSPTMKTNLPKYLMNASVRMKTVRMLTDHVIQAVSNDIMTVFHNNRLQAAKYMDDETKLMHDEVAQHEALDDASTGTAPIEDNSDAESNDGEAEPDETVDNASTGSNNDV